MELTRLNKTLAEIFKSRYVVPLYQRNFAWSDEEISQLLQDVYENFRLDKTGNYFIGSLVVLRRATGELEVIDGQQRLTAISLIAKVLEVDFLTEPKLYYDSRPEVESFLSSFYASGQTNDVTFDHKVSHLIHAVDLIRESIINPNEKVESTLLNIEDLAGFKEYFSKKVILVRVEIPQDTDVANYFEIMNNRGEQLQKHEIMKAKLMNNIKNKGVHDIQKQKLFSKIWDACSQMAIPIQKLFSKDDRIKYFGENYSGFNGILWDDTLQQVEKQLKEDEGESIDQILSGTIKSTSNIISIKDIDDEGEDTAIIDFPNFLMHILRIQYNDLYIEMMGVKANKASDIPLNEKDLLSVFDVISERIEPIIFVENLLYFRTIFDRYIIKASRDDGEEDKYKWSSVQPNKYTYEKTGITSLKYKPTFEKQEGIIKALSLMQVTFRNRKYKNWLQDILKWFADREKMFIEKEDYQTFLNSWLLKYYQENISSLPPKKGTDTPHFLFNFIDYLYWIKSIKESSSLFNFEFKYRNSVEHHLPQSFRNETNKDWIDNLGNLCLISKSSNSKMNNEAPGGKASKEGKYYKTSLPPKQKLMYDLTNQQKAWTIGQIELHNLDVVELLATRNEILTQQIL